MIKMHNITDEKSWNPITGCDHVSDGCLNCYAEKLSNRLRECKKYKYEKGFELTLHPDYIREPFRWHKSKIVLVCDMSDMFHKDVPKKFILAMFQVMNECTNHLFQILTKRPERLLTDEFAGQINWTKNIWLGVSVESPKYEDRILALQQIKEPKVRYVALEPLLSEYPELPLDGINWVIVSGESGHRPRRIKREWVMQVRDQCLKKKVPFFFKQWGGFFKKRNGRVLDGEVYDQMPKIEIMNFV